MFSRIKMVQFYAKFSDLGYGFICLTFLLHFLTPAYGFISKGYDGKNERINFFRIDAHNQRQRAFTDVIGDELMRVEKLIRLANSIISNQRVTAYLDGIKFEKPNYALSTTSDYIGILIHFKIEGPCPQTIKYALCSDDVYINRVFRMGTDSGILYADTEIKPGIYKFYVSADVPDKPQMHAKANVSVIVAPANKTRDLIFEGHSIHLFIAGQKIGSENHLPQAGFNEENPELVADGKGGPLLPDPFSERVDGDVDTNEIFSPHAGRPWKVPLKKTANSQLRSERIRTGEKRLEDIFEPRPEIKLILPEGDSKKFRVRRGLPPVTEQKIYTRSSSSSAASLLQRYNSTAVNSLRIYQETPFADFVMSAFILFVVSFGSVVFFGSLLYFAYKRLKKCGDYEVDEDVKPVEKQPEDEIIMQGDLKKPYLSCISEINQKRVTDSIEITKQKLNNGQASVFTIQRSYEKDSADDDKIDDDVFVVDMTQSSINSSSEVYNTITLQTLTKSTPAITATLITDQQPVSNETSLTEECNGGVVKVENSVAQNTADIKLEELNTSSYVPTETSPVETVEVADGKLTDAK